MSDAECHDHLRMAILGTARIAEKVAPHIAATNEVELVGVASRQASKASDFARRFNVPIAYSSYEDALADPAIDAVYLPLPPSLHCEWACKAAAAGKHILVEKPLAGTIQDAETMLQATKDADVVLLDGVMWYHTARAKRIQEIVNTGTLGELKQLHSVFTFRWDTLPMDNIRMHRSMGGGALLDLGWYCVGVSLWLFDCLPESVSARAEFRNDVDTRMNAILQFPDQRLAGIECSFDAVRRRWLELAGSQAALRCDDFTRPFQQAKPEITLWNNDGLSQTEVIPHPPIEQCMVAAFADLVRQRNANHEWHELSRRTQLVCDAIDRAARTRQSVDVA